MSVVDWSNYKYHNRWLRSRANRFNGAYYYAKEIAKYMIPSIQTDRNWILVNQEGEGYDHSIVFIHNNLHPENYDWLSDFSDLILVCGIPETKEKVAHLGETIYLPLSIDVEEVKSFRTEKTKDVAFVGRAKKHEDISLPEGTDFIENLPRPVLLKKMAAYRQVYAVGRTALEAKVLGCEVLPYDPRFPDPDIWEVHDSKEMALVLQKLLNETEEKLYRDFMKRSLYD